jgi:hypothetical protein
MNTFESHPYRDNLAKEIKEAPKEKRRAILDGAKETPEYWQAREEKIGERQDEEVINDGLGVFVKAKMLYHGSPVSGIDTFTQAEEDTVGSGIYFTSESKDAVNYARLRTKSRGKEGDLPIIYEAKIENMKLLDLRKTENLFKILPGFKKILQERRKVENIKWQRQAAIDAAIDEIDKGQVKAGELRKITFSVGLDFSEYVKSLGYDGLITYEGGEGETPEDHDTYLIFDTEKARIVQEHKIV